MINYEGCYRSAIDDALHGYIISVPDNYSANGAKLPVIFSLQGLGCQPGDFDVNIGRIIQYPVPYDTEINLHTMIYNHGLEVPAVVAAIQFAKWENIWNAGVINEFIDIVTGRINVPTTNQPTSPVDGATPLNGLHKYNVDWNKVHLTAISQGGQGCTDLLNTQWAKICTYSVFGGVSTWYSIDSAKGAKVNKAFIRHHTGDPVVSVDFARNLRTAIVNGHSGDTSRVDFVEKPISTHEVWSDEYQKEVDDPTGVIAFHLAHSLQDFGFPDQNPVEPDPEPIPLYKPIFDIKRGGSVIATVKPKIGERREGTMSVDVIDMSFELPEYVEFLKGDTIEFDGQEFTLYNPSDLERVKKYGYELQFLSERYLLNEAKVYGPDENNELTEYDCHFTGTAEAALDFIILNANRVNPGWIKGVVDTTEAADFDFTGDSCDTAITKLSDIFKTENWVNGRTINLSKKGNNSGLSFRYGKGKGLTKLKRKATSAKIVTRLKVLGSTKNLPLDYPGLLNKRLRMPDNQLFIEDADKVLKYGPCEDTKIFEEVFPRRIGTVTGLGNAYTFSDSTINFDINNQLILNTAARVKFITGQLAGWEFDIRENGYNHTTKTIVINQNDQEQAIEVPSSSGLKPAIGDQYILINIVMPSSYVTDAENELEQKALEYYEEVSDPRVVYSAELDRKYLRANQFEISIGDYVNILEPDAGIDKDIRVISKITNILDPYNVQIELADVSSVNQFVKQLLSERAIQRAISANQLSDINRTRQNRKTQAEVINMIFNPVTGKILNNKIDVDWINAQLITVGTAAQDFILQTTFVPNFQGDVSKFAYTSGSLAHNVLTDHQNGIWIFAASSFTGLSNPIAYYIYATCPYNSNIATISLSTSVLTVDSTPNAYVFLIGILSSVIDGFRTVSNTKGKTTIHAGELSTGIIKNQSGQSVLDLDERKFYGSFQFSNGDDIKTITDQIQEDLTQVSSDATEAKNFIDNVLPLDLQEIRDQLDGVIQSWFDNHTPTLSNFPAVDWTTNAIKDDHLGDLYYDNDDGLGYRFSKDGSAYVWTLLNDTDAAQALAIANLAKDTADGKRRVFVATPYTPYDAGDLWSQGPTGDLMRCVTSRLTGSYSASDWEKSNKYTDDTTANEALEKANVTIAEIENVKETADKAHAVTNYLFTTVNGNLVATGTFIVGDATGNNNAGITGVVDNGAASVRFWAGVPYANRNTAPFRVQNDGKVFLNKAVISGDIQIGFDAGDDPLGYTSGWKLSKSAMLNDAGNVGSSDGNNFALIRASSKFSNNNLNQFSFGTELVPSINGGQQSLIGRIENSRPKLGSSPGWDDTTNTALSLSAKGANNNNAIDVVSGNSKFKGIIYNVKVVNSNYTMTDDDYFVLATANCTIYMPAKPQVGKVVEIGRSTSASVALNGNGVGLVNRANPIVTSKALEYQERYIFANGYWRLMSYIE